MIDGAKIRSLREGAGLTMKELADDIGVAEAQISHYERHLKNPSATTSPLD